MHVRAGQKTHAAAARMEIDHILGHRKKDGSEVVCKHLADTAVGVARKAAVEIAPIKRRQARGRFGRGRIETRHQDQRPRHMRRRQLTPEFENRHLSEIGRASCRERV